MGLRTDEPSDSDTTIVTLFDEADDPDSITMLEAAIEVSFKALLWPLVWTHVLVVPALQKTWAWLTQPATLEDKD